MGSSNKKTLYSTRSCVNWAFFGTRGPLQFFEERTIAVLILLTVFSVFVLVVNWAFLALVAHSCQKSPIYTRTR
jgi:hypothetical protein